MRNEEQALTSEHRRAGGVNPRKTLSHQRCRLLGNSRLHHEHAAQPRFARNGIQLLTQLARLFVVLCTMAMFVQPTVISAQGDVSTNLPSLDDTKAKLAENLDANKITITTSETTIMRIEDRNGDDGTALNIEIECPPDVAEIDLRISEREDGLYKLVETLELKDGRGATEIKDLKAGDEIWIGVFEDDSTPPILVPATPTRELFDTNRIYLLLTGLIICGSILGFIYAARRGYPMWVRPIPALTAVDEAVGRATEMGKDVLFVPGIQDINDIQTIAGLTILGHVAERTADYRASLEVPTSKSLVMTAAAETVESAYLEAGRQDYFNPNAVSYITDEQFGYVAYLSGYMVREKPAACFYLGAFFAESLILAETGNAVGAVQVAGTAQPSQLPFFVAACDYTLIGEEFFAASAYLSGDPDKLGSLKGQDVGKVFVGVAVLIGVSLLTLAVVTGDPSIAEAADYWKSTILAGG